MDEIEVPVIEVEPTPEQIAEWAAYNDPQAVYEREYADVEQARRDAYVKDSDPLFFGFQRGENTEQAWLDAVQAVKDAHPYPEPPVK